MRCATCSARMSRGCASSTCSSLCTPACQFPRASSARRVGKRALARGAALERLAPALQRGERIAHEAALEDRAKQQRLRRIGGREAGVDADGVIERLQRIAAIGLEGVQGALVGFERGAVGGGHGVAAGVVVHGHLLVSNARIVRTGTPAFQCRFVVPLYPVRNDYCDASKYP